jgi:hypothetical protein
MIMVAQQCNVLSVTQDKFCYVYFKKILKIQATTKTQAAALPLIFQYVADTVYPVSSAFTSSLSSCIQLFTPEVLLVILFHTHKTTIMVSCSQTFLKHSHPLQWPSPHTQGTGEVAP